MAPDILEEIARRLGDPTDDVAPVLETVVQRIQQQVEHYGYARLAGLGTFRDRDERIFFEPDPALAETINARYAGLEDILLKADEESPSDEQVAVVAAAEGDRDDVDKDDSTADDASAISNEEVERAGFEDIPPGDEPVDLSDQDASVDLASAAGLDAEGVDSEPDDEEIFWADEDRTAETHPLGPETEPPYEEADYAVLEGDQGVDEPPVSEEEPTISWAPLGAGEHDPEDEFFAAADASSEEAPLTEEGALTPSEERSRSEKVKAPDRTAEPHGLREDGPVRTIHPPGRRSSRRRDVKPIWFGAAVILLVAAAAIAYFALPEQPATPATEESPQMQTPALADTASSAADTSVAAVQAPPPVAPPSSPLRSEEGIQPADGGFTIVVHSETEENSAAEVSADYSNRGFRSSVLAAEQAGVTRYRVGIGQFETLEEATQTRNELAGTDLPDDAWVLRL